MILSDDQEDRYLLNEGNDVFGRVDWGPARVFNTDDGFGSNNYIIDLNGDDFAEAIICDVDVDLGGCDRRLHIYHNRGGTVGGVVSLVEERSGSTFGAQGLPALRGTHDVAIFDIDNDGDRDMVVGRCSGTRVYLNERNALGVDYCEAAANSTGQSARLRVEGSPRGEQRRDPASGLAPARAVRDLPREPGSCSAQPRQQLRQPLPARALPGPGQVVAASAAGEFSISIDLTAPPIGSTRSWPTPVTPSASRPVTGTISSIPTSNFTSATSVTFR